MYDDYVYYVEVAVQHPGIWPVKEDAETGNKTANALKSEIHKNRQEWLEAGVILPAGNGTERKKWLFSFEAYIDHLRNKPPERQSCCRRPDTFNATCGVRGSNRRT